MQIIISDWAIVAILATLGLLYAIRWGRWFKVSARPDELTVETGSEPTPTQKKRRTPLPKGNGRL